MFTHICGMFKKLQQHWGVNGWRFFLILCTFAVTGTVTAWVSRQITGWLDVNHYSLAWWLLKISVLFIGYQGFILIIGFCFGQFSFFWNYEKKILRRFGLLKKQTGTARLVIFASGGGSNAGNIINYFKEDKSVKVVLIVCNKEGAGVLQIAKEYNIDTLLINKQDENGERILNVLKDKKTDLVVLAGYLWKLPPLIVSSFPHRIINIHPALLPEYGGKGMYGKHVHQAVISKKERYSGITIHYVDEVYDHGEIIFQERCNVDITDTADSLAQKVLVLEHLHYPVIIKQVLEKQNRS